MLFSVLQLQIQCMTRTRKHSVESRAPLHYQCLSVHRMIKATRNHVQNWRRAYTSSLCPTCHSTELVFCNPQHALIIQLAKVFSSSIQPSKSCLYAPTNHNMCTRKTLSSVYSGFAPTINSGCWNHSMIVERLRLAVPCAMCSCSHLQTHIEISQPYGIKICRTVDLLFLS